jgi:uncharacterized membrane protein YbhN (UPF0104 family)
LTKFKILWYYLNSPLRVLGERSGLMRAGKKLKTGGNKRMSKISAFLVGTIGLSLAMLIPIYFNFQKMADKIKEIGVSKVFPNLWQGFALIAFVIVISVGTLMALLIFGGGEKNVL